MTKRSKFLTSSLAAVLVAAALVGWAMAQGSGEQSPTSAAPQQNFLGRVAANLGVTEERLLEAVTQAHLQMIDEAVAQGRITQEQADWMKQQITASQALLGMIDEAVVEGRITEQQAAWMKQQIGGSRWMGWGPQGFCGRSGGQGRGSFGHWGGRGMMAPPQSPSSP